MKDADLRDFEEKYWERQFAKQDAEWKRLNVRGPSPLGWFQRTLLAGVIVCLSILASYHFVHWVTGR